MDLFKAHLYAVVDDSNEVIQTISTHRGTYKFNRLSFGIKTAPNEFHRILGQILTGLRGVTVYYDDIIIHGKNIKEYYERLQKCLDKLRAYDLHLNKRKYQFFRHHISYSGYVISENKISKCPKKGRICRRSRILYIFPSNCQ